MKHFWINIKKNNLRNDFMSSQFKKYNIENVRIDAITPNDFDDVLEQKRPLTCKYPGCTTCEYEFACLCSHIKAMKEGLKSGEDYFVIMEDDIEIVFDIDYDKIIKEVPNDAEVIQLMVLYGNTVKILYNYYITKGIKYIPWKYLLPSTGMYIISKEGAKKMLDKFYDIEKNTYNFSSSPYQIVADVLIYETLKSYATTVPYCVPNIAMGSEIHPEHLSAHQITINVISDVINTRHENFPFIIKKY